MAEIKHLAESDRNRLLRRVDWRFLLNVEEKPSAICFASRRLARAVAIISDLRPREALLVDLVVVVNPTRRKLSAGFAALRPGGELYAEWHWPNNAKQSQKRLQIAGFTDVKSYWPWPASGAASFWLPLDAPLALDFHLRSQPDERRGRRRKIAATLWRAAQKRGLLIPVCTVARKPGGKRTGIEEIIRADSYSTSQEPEHLSWLLLTGGSRSTNKAVALAFNESDTRPGVAVKFARSASEEEALRREAKTLQHLQTALPTLLGVPKVLGFGWRSGCLALAETAVAGRPLMFRLNTGSLQMYAEEVTEWLATLAGTPTHVPPDTWWPRLVDEPLREFEENFRDVIDKSHFRRARELISSLHSLPLVCEHRDCSPWNILATDEGELAVVDWESSEPNGLAGLDLVYFLTYAALFVDGATTQPNAARLAYAAMLDPHSLTGRVAVRCGQTYCQRLGLDVASLHPLRLLCWTLHASSEHRRLKADANGTPAPGTLRGSFFLGLWEEELRRAQLSFA